MGDVSCSLRVIACAGLAGLSGCGGCAGSSGHIVGRQPSAQFVTEPATIFVNSAAGIERMNIDGTDRRVVFARRGEMGWNLLDTTPDLTFFLLGNSNTELFVGEAATGNVRPVPAIGDRASSAHFSPDGKRFAVARHSNYRVPKSPEDDTIYLGDTATLAIEEIPPETSDWPSTLRWAKDGSGVWVKMNWEGKAQWVTLPDKKRHHDATEAPVPLDTTGHPSRPICAERPASDRWDTHLRMVPADAGIDANGGRVIAQVEGRKRGFHDYQPDFYDPLMSPRCDYVVFGFQGSIWVTDAKGSGNVAALVEGGASAMFFVPAAP